MNISRSALLPYSAPKMYQVVADIKDYPAFLPGCKSAKIVEQKTLIGGTQQVIATVNVSYAKLDLQFTTCNTNQPNESIELNLVDGPFSSLHGLWSFEYLSDEACKVQLDMTFKFSNPLMDKIMGSVFGKVVDKQFEAFQNRAKKLYFNEQ